MKSRMLVLIAILASALVGCSDLLGGLENKEDVSGETPVPPGGEILPPGDPFYDVSRRLRPESLDIRDSKYLFITSGGTKTKADGQEGPGLFKVDENGNVSAVLFTCVQTEIIQRDTVVVNDSIAVRDTIITMTETVRTDLSLLPDIIQSHTNEYISMVISNVTDSNGNVDANGMSYLDQISQYYGGNGGKLHLFIRVSDGKIFFIPENAYWEYFNKASTLSDAEGDMYLFNYGVAAKVSESGEALTVQKLNPEGMYFSDFAPLDNGAMFCGEYLMYPNGSMDVLPEPDWEKFEDIYALKVINGSLKAVRVFRSVEMLDEVRQEIKYRLELCDFVIGTSRGSWSFEPLASLEMDEYTWPRRAWEMDPGMNTFGNIYETSSHYVIGRFGTWDKTSDAIELFDDETAGAILFPGEGNPDEYGNMHRNPDIYKDRVWGVDVNGSKVSVRWFDMETLAYGDITYDLTAYPDGFQLISHNISIPTGEVLANGINLTNMNKVAISLNIETGEMTSIESANSQEIVTLIPLN